jgi:hypothetical protein
MFATNKLLLAMHKDGRSTFWHTWCCRGVVLSDPHLFYFLFPSYQITCVDFVWPFGDKLPKKNLDEDYM